MSYVLGGTAGESNTFEKTLANSAIAVIHESSGLVNYTSVVQPNQGNVYKVPSLSPITFEDYDETSDTPTVQSPAIGAKEVEATAAVAQTKFGKFLLETSAFSLAVSSGAELGGSFAEKVDQRVAAAFSGFKATTGNTNYTVTGGDGFDRVSILGALELLAATDTPVGAAASKSVVGLVRKVVNEWRKARNAGRPVIVLGPEEADRLLEELTDPSGNLSALGNELQSTGEVKNLYGATLVFTTWLGTASRAVDGAAAADVRVGAAIGPQALTTVMKQNLEVATGLMDGGLFYWLTGTGYFGAGVTSTARGMAINIA